MYTPMPRRKNERVERPIPQRPKNQKKDYLTSDQINELIRAADSRGRHQHRDSTMILIMYRHGLRAIETTWLKWEDITWSESTIYVPRAKNGIPTTHNLQPDELEALQELKRLSPPDSIYIFSGEGSEQFCTENIGRIVKSAANLAKLSDVHPHTLRHSCGYYLANKGYTTRDIQVYLGHSNIQNTMTYTEIAPNRFNFIQWK